MRACARAVASHCHLPLNLNLHSHHARTQTDRDSREDINKVFRLFDAEGRGYITVKEVARVARELGEGLTESEAMEMVERADSNSDGKVTADDFYAIMTRRTLG